jgi:GNAT superfamily N-acetyltransferase
VSGQGREPRPPVRIRPADRAEAQRLRGIAAAAKQHWGYDHARVAAWAQELDVASGAIGGKEISVAEAGGEAVGWMSVIPTGDVLWLEDMWVVPEWMGRGVGSQLFAHARRRARDLRARRIEWEAEPNAVGFYERMGARYLRDSAPSEWGRILPVMGLEVADAGPGRGS